MVDSAMTLLLVTSLSLGAVGCAAFDSGMREGYEDVAMYNAHGDMITDVSVTIGNRPLWFGYAATGKHIKPLYAPPDAQTVDFRWTEIDTGRKYLAEDVPIINESTGHDGRQLDENDERELALRIFEDNTVVARRRQFGNHEVPPPSQDPVQAVIVEE